MEEGGHVNAFCLHRRNVLQIAYLVDGAVRALKPFEVGVELTFQPPPPRYAPVRMPLYVEIGVAQAQAQTPFLSTRKPKSS